MAFADSLRVIWQVMIGVSGLGLVSSLLMEHKELHLETDQDWDLGVHENMGADVEKASPSPSDSIDVPGHVAAR